MKLHLLSGLFIFMSWTLYAQESIQLSIDQNALAYMNTVSDQSVIFNGREQERYHFERGFPLRSSTQFYTESDINKKILYPYVLYNPDTNTSISSDNKEYTQRHVRKHPYFKDARYFDGRISVNGVVYPVIPIRLDLSRNEFIILSPHNRQVVLFNEHVDYVEFHHCHIFNFRSDSLPGCPPSGFYILLHSGKCTILEKQSSFLQPEKNDYYYDHTVKFYLRKDGVYYPVKNKRSLLNALGSHKSELKKLIRNNRYKFRRNAEELLVSVVKEYETLSDSL